MLSNERALSVNHVFQQHLDEREFWQEVVEVVKGEISLIVRQLAIPGRVEGRAKTTGSVIGKAMRKPDRYSDLSAFGDLAAVRAVVPFPSYVGPLASEISAHPGFRVLHDESKIPEKDSLAYQARHLDVEIGWTHFRPDESTPRSVRCEIQIQTFAESLWASVSHLVTYKRDALPDEVHRRVNRLIVLCELFDDEIGSARELALKSIDFTSMVATDIDRYYMSITGIADVVSAPEIVALLINAIGDQERESYPSTLERFVSLHSDRLALLLADRPEARGNPWFLRPEAILIFERLTNRPALFAASWEEHFAAADLNDLDSAWGPV